MGEPLVQTPGTRCPSVNETLRMQCSRDIGHPGAHVNRAEIGRGLVGWHNADAPMPETRRLLAACRLAAASLLANITFRKPGGHKP